MSTKALCVASSRSVSAPVTEAVIVLTRAAAFQDDRPCASSLFQAEYKNITSEINLAPDEAVLESDLQVPTPDGLVTMKVPSGVTSG